MDQKKKKRKTNKTEHYFNFEDEATDA